MQSNYLNILKKYAADIVVVILFALVSVAYFMPAVSEGRILYRHDASAGRGAGQEISMFKEQTGEQSRWTNALFSGMPTYQSAPAYDSAQTLSEISNKHPETMSIVDAIQQQTAAIDRQTETIREVASEPTHYHAEGSNYYDMSKQLNIESSEKAKVNIGKLLE